MHVSGSSSVRPSLLPFKYTTSVRNHTRRRMFTTTRPRFWPAVFLQAPSWRATAFLEPSAHAPFNAGVNVLLAEHGARHRVRDG